jgi:hypothetical protein
LLTQAGTGESVRGASSAEHDSYRLKAVAQTSGEVEFLCECADLDCTENLVLSMAEYEHIRTSPVRFPIAPGHDYPEVENVVEENERYAVVQKKGEAAEIVAELDARSP